MEKLNRNIIFIEEVKKRKYLWDKSDRDYRNKMIVGTGWNEVAQECQISEDDARKKWKNFRDTFTKEFKKNSTKLGSSNEEGNETSQKSLWVHYNSLEFLTQTFTPNPPEEDIPDIKFTNVQYCGNCNENISPTKVDTKRKKTISEELLEIEKEKLKLFRTEENENFLFFKSIVPTMNNFTQLQQLKLRTRISQLMVDETELAEKEYIMNEDGM